MLVVVNQPHTSFRIEGDIPVGILDYVGREYGKENIAVIDDDGDEAGSFQYGKRHPSHKQKNCEGACSQFQSFR